MGRLNLRPPPASPSQELRWMLLRGFGPPEASFESMLEAESAAELAKEFHLRERIAARIGRAVLTAELGPELSGEFQAAWRRAAAETMRLSTLAGTAAGVAADHGIPLVFLKFAALDALKAASPGSRPAADVDLLVPAARVHELQKALQESGLVPGDYKPCEHHLVSLRSPAGGSLELHYRLPGVRFRGRRSIGAEDLLETGRVIRLPQFPGKCYAPDPELHAAYLIVHGFVQHGPFPRTYSLMRVLADLMDLEDSSGSAGSLRIDSIFPLVRREVTKADLSAIFRLGDRLKKADETLVARLADKGPGGEVALLQHILARTLSRAYQERLVFRTLLPMSDSPRPVVFARSALKKLVPTGTHLDKVYGPRSSRLGYVSRRLNRPFDLFLRLWRAFGGRPGVENQGKIGEDMPRVNTKKGVRDEIRRSADGRQIRH